MPSKACRLSDLVHFSRGTNITAGEMNFGKYPVVSAGLNYSGFHNAFNVSGPSITVSASGANAGVVLFHNYDFWAADCNFADSSSNIIFAYYFLKYLQPVIFNMQNGSAQPHVYAKNLNNLKVALPAADSDQSKIANILSAYDKLIENNNKRIAILEQEAEELYEEWFVRFRYPGYKNSKFVDGVPFEWSYVRFKDIATIIRGVSYSSDEIDVPNGNYLVNLKNIRSYGGYNFNEEKTYIGSFKNNQTLSKLDLIMGVTDMTQDRRCVGSVALCPEFNKTAIFSADLIKISSEYSNIFLYCHLKYGNYSKYISEFANGANVLHLRPKYLENVKILMPNKILIEKFSSICKPIFDSLLGLVNKNNNLQIQRDYLLPRLMSGKLEVK